VTDPGLWHRDFHPPDYVGLCDSARFAELIGLNVVDAFPARDVALDGRGTPLDALPIWLLLHQPQKNRLVVQSEPHVRTLFLPGTRDESGANHVEVNEFENMDAVQAWLAGCVGLTERSSWGESTVEEPDAAEIDEVLLISGTAVAALPASLSHLALINEVEMGISSEALPAACAAILAMMHIDQTPANIPLVTGATAQRVLGRLTPGNAYAWHRLLRDLVFARPLVTPLRAAV
jgi:hypothetical protein